MSTSAIIATFQLQRHRTLMALAAGIALACAVGVVAYYFFGITVAIAAWALSLALALIRTARFAYRAFRCPKCGGIPMKVQVRAWTKYTRYLRQLQISRRFTTYPAWAVLFLDLNPVRCPSCGVSLVERGAEYASAT